MRSPDLSSTPLSTLETATEEFSSLKKLHDFNVAEKSQNLKKLASEGIDTVKSFFKQLNIKNALQSFFKKKSNTKTPNKLAIAIDKSKNKAQMHQNLSTDTIKVPEQFTVLKELNNLEGTSMQSEIYQYYLNNNIKSIHSFLNKKNIPAKNIDIATDRILTNLAQKRVKEFKDSVATKLQDTELSKDEFAEFWAWRIANPPKEKPLLVRTDSGIEIKYDEFASSEAIKKFLSNHVSKLSDDFFNSLQDEQTSDTDLPSNIKTSKDIEKDIEYAIGGTTSNIDSTTSQNTGSQQLSYDIEKQSNGWINSAMYEKIASISAGQALFMLGSINAELKPSARTLLSEMRHLLNSQDTNQTFESLVQQILNTKNDNPPKEKTLKALSNIVNKLNKVVVLSEEK